ncbi:MAG: type II/IV secretion system protein [Sphingobacteriales bacterium]|nr:MAG: type II/IV secretion system protein [Sphingobacteriales bacterium]
MSNSLHDNLIKYVPSEIAWRYRTIPHKFDAGILTLLIDNISYKQEFQGELELILGHEVCLLKEEPEIISQQLSKLYRKDNTSNIIIRNDESADDFLIKVISEAKDLGSSDIHVESYSEKCRIRLRVDGKLLERYHISKEIYPSFINKIKIKARLDIAEKRLPQDGRMLLHIGNGKIDIRVSVLPSLYGEKVVLRLLSNDSTHIQLDNLGFNGKQLDDYKKVLKRPHGIILISGPTGSGKTTTLYATLKLLNSEHSNILTIEDPIEYTLDGINQVQLKENIGLTFASALKTFLRQDPDIIMLGEIRDGETAQMAIRAALTGHLVLSTIHTNSAWGTISRLVDMGVPTFLLANTLNATIAQRLVRKLCAKCKTPGAISDSDLYHEVNDTIGSDTIHYHPVGCEYCYYTGYHGRVALYEVIPVDGETSRAIKDNRQDITAMLAERKISTLRDQAIDILLSGITSLEEVYPILLNH